jgi:hypothetical protein
MKVEELRVGNLVHYFTNELTPNKIDAEDIYLMSEKPSYLAQHTPIPLTKELMEKNLGFEFACTYFSLDEFYGQYYDDHFYIEVFGIEHEFHFVHELQNIYFDLVKKELEYSLA